ATALGHDAVEEGAHLLPVEGEVAPLHQEILALARAGARLAVVPIAVGDGADAGGRDEMLDGRRQCLQVVLQCIDHVLHAAGGVTDARDGEPALAEPPPVTPEGGAEGPARPAPPPPDPETAHARSARGEARAEIDPRADRADGPGEMHDRRRR